MTDVRCFDNLLYNNTLNKLHSGVFLHDFRVKAEGVKVKTTRQVKPSNLIKDTFYWPDMNVSFELYTCFTENKIVIHRKEK
jgi:hypothetical protein